MTAMKQSTLKVLNNNDAVPGLDLSRRRVMQRMLGTAGAGLVLPGLASGHPMHNHLMNGSSLQSADSSASASDWQPGFFDAHQNETLIVLAERIVPNSGQAQV